MNTTLIVILLIATIFNLITNLFLIKGLSKLIDVELINDFLKQILEIMTQEKNLSKEEYTKEEIQEPKIDRTLIAEPISKMDKLV